MPEEEFVVIDTANNIVTFKVSHLSTDDLCGNAAASVCIHSSIV